MLFPKPIVCTFKLEYHGQTRLPACRVYSRLLCPFGAFEQRGMSFPGQRQRAATRVLHACYWFSQADQEVEHGADAC